MLALNRNKKLYFDYQIIKQTKVKNVRDISHDFDYAWMQLTDTVSSAARYALHLAQAVGDPRLTPEQTLKAARKLSKVLRKNIGDTPATHYAVIPKNIFGLAEMNTAIAFEKFPDPSEENAIMQTIVEMRRFSKDPTQRKKIRSFGSGECEGLHTLTRPKTSPFAEPE